MEKKINLRTHDGSNNYLMQFDDKRPNSYKLVTAFNTLRHGYLDNDIEFVDPSGGPMLYQGKKLEGTHYIVEGISFEEGIGTIIILKNDLSSN